MAVGIGLGVGYGIFEPQTSRAEAQALEQDEEIASLRQQIADSDLQFTALMGESSERLQVQSTLQTDLDAIARELEQQRSAAEQVEAELDSVRDRVAEKDASISELSGHVESLAVLEAEVTALKEAVGPLEALRLLLVEVRKSTPESRKAAEDYWQGMKRLAVEVDPSLGPKADRVLRLIPVYFDWIEQSFTTSCESVDALVNTGAIDFGTVVTDFQKDVLLTLINRMDAIVTRAG
jgi:hypothetical protein